MSEPRPLAALGYLAHGPVVDGLIELDKLVLVLLADAAPRNGNHWPRLAGFGGRPVPWGVRWGGCRQHRFLKNLALKPESGARGRRIDADDQKLLELGIALHREIDHRSDNRWLPVGRSIQLPKIWAGFRMDHALRLCGDGPEITAQSRRMRIPSCRLLQLSRRVHQELAFFPLEWVSHHYRDAVAFHADLHRFPKRQVFPLRGRPEDSFCGYMGAVEYDFIANRFNGRRRARRRSSSRRR